MARSSEKNSRGGARELQWRWQCWHSRSEGEEAREKARAGARESEENGECASGGGRRGRGREREEGGEARVVGLGWLR